MHFRQERVGDLLKSFLAQELRELVNLSLGLITVTAVKISPDLKHARVYWTMFGVPNSQSQDDSCSEQKTSTKSPSVREIRHIQDLLEESEKHLKKRIAQELELRYVPSLHFHYDESVAHGLRIEELLSKTKL